VIRLPPELLERHGLPGPRYTSYPTAMHWGAAPPADAWLGALDRALSRREARAGLYVHIPFCSALCTFCGCNMRVARSHALAAPYVGNVLKEHAMYRSRIARPSLALGGLYLGGGTPTWLPLEELERLLDTLLANASVAPGADFVVEADPRNTTREQLAVLCRHGFRRITIGVQDFDERVLGIVNRPQTEAEVRRTMTDARELGFTSVGVDLIYGLPLQTVDSLRTTFTILQRLRPDYVNFLPYAHVPWIKPSQRLYTESDLPDAALRRELYLLGRERLGAAGYLEIGIDQYAMPEDPLARALAAGSLSRSFMGFSSSSADALIGLGVSAIGAASSMYAQNEKNLQRYEMRLAANELPLQRGHMLDADDLAIRELLTELLASRPARLSENLRRQPWWPEVREALLPLAHDGLLELGEERAAATELGRAFLPRIGMAVDRYLRRAQAA